MENHTKAVGNKQGTAWRVDRIVSREQKGQRLPGFGGMPIFGTKVTREVHESRIDEGGNFQYRTRTTESMTGAILHDASGRALLNPKRSAYMGPKATRASYRLRAEGGQVSIVTLHGATVSILCGGLREESPLPLDEDVVIRRGGLVHTFCRKSDGALTWKADKEDGTPWLRPDGTECVCTFLKWQAGCEGQRRANGADALRQRKTVSQWRRPGSARTAGHAPRTARRSTRSAATASPGNDDDGGSDGPSDEPASPATPLASDLDKRRNKLHSEHSHNNNLIELLDRLQLGSAALMLAAVASLVMRWSK